MDIIERERETNIQLFYRSLYQLIFSNTFVQRTYRISMDFWFAKRKTLQHIYSADFIVILHNLNQNSRIDRYGKKYVVLLPVPLIMTSHDLSNVENEKFSHNNFANWMFPSEHSEIWLGFTYVIVSEYSSSNHIHSMVRFTRFFFYVHFHVHVFVISIYELYDMTNYRICGSYAM